MGKRCFVRINVDAKQYKLDRRDIVQTHYFKKRRGPKIPTFPPKSKCQHTDVEEDSETNSIFDDDYDRCRADEGCWGAPRLQHPNNYQFST